MPFLLTIDGCPYGFATAGVTSASSTDQDWPTGATLLANTLDTPRATISERMRPIDGDLDVSGHTFRLFDVVTSTGEAAGYNLVTRLATLSASNNPSTEITSDLAESGTVSFTVGDGSQFATSGTAYLEQEAIQFTRIGNTFTIVSRGRYGSRAVEHVRDTANAYSPALFKYYPGFTRRRVVLWEIGSNSIARPLWRGYCMRAPRLAGDGASYEIQCESAWSIERDQRVGIPEARIKLRGFDTRAISAQVVIVGGLRGIYATYYDYTAPQAIFDTLLDALQFVLNQLNARLEASGYENEFNLTLRPEEGGIAFTARTATAQFELMLDIGGNRATARSDEATDSAPYAKAVVNFLPEMLVRVFAPRAAEPIPVRSVAGLPASWTPTTTAEDNSSHSTTVRLTLRADLGDGRYLQLEPSASSAADPPTVTASTLVDFYDPYVPANDQGRLGVTVSHNVDLLLTTTVRTSHWVYGIRRGLFAEQANTSADPRNWDWTYADQVVRTTSQADTARTWHFDGTQRFGEFVLDVLALYGCGLGVRESRLALVPFRGSLSTDTVVASIPSTAFVSKPTWSTFPDGLCNVAELDSDAVKIVVRDQASIARYGQARSIKLKLDGANDAVLIASTPQQLVSDLLQRVLGLWSRPTAVAKIVVPAATYMHAVYLGDQITVTEWMLPVGDGTRGLVSRTMQVIGRELDLGAGTLALECVIYDLGNVAGFAPALRVGSRSGTTTINAMRSYLTESDSLTDYSGAAGLSSDGGVSYFQPGDRVRLIQRDTTSLVTQDLIVDTVNPQTSGNSQITFTTSINGTFQTLIDDSNKWVDLIYSHYDTSGLQAGQKAYAWVADDADNKIGASSDPAHVWSP